MHAGVVKLVDAPDSKSGSERSVGSIPTARTTFVCAMPPTNPSRGYGFALLRPTIATGRKERPGSTKPPGQGGLLRGKSPGSRGFPNVKR